MSENKKFTKDEISEITNLRNSNSLAISDFGQIELEIFLTNQRLEALNNRKEELKENYKNLQEKEKELVKTLNERYGAGTVDLESGEFIPAN
tara:strand:- start:82 stop:357 length:276 start_codon:yes stop_codon:yes gene_type:complete